jgi:NAD-dependent dihydropyrimidine dehydrogenase PreA subunit
LEVARFRSRRERFPWFPAIDREACICDLECLNHCPADVFEWHSSTGRPIVARPLDCIPGCRICAENCKVHCISLPGKEEVAAALKRIRKEDGITSSGAKGKKRAHPQTQGARRVVPCGDKGKTAERP